MKTIEKKILPEYFEKILSGQKTYELRLADWDCQSGDKLILKEIDPESKQFTGRELTKKVGYVGKTKDQPHFSEDEVEKYGFQIISLLEDER